MSAFRSRRRRGLRGILVLVVVLGLAYAAWFAMLAIGSTEGDVPPASALPLPGDAQIVGTDEGCGSGGCWAIFTVRPAKGSSPQEISRYFDSTLDGHVAGSVFDPRTVNLSTAVQGNVVVVTASYW